MIDIFYDAKKQIIKNKIKRGIKKLLIFQFILNMIFVGFMIFVMDPVIVYKDDAEAIAMLEEQKEVLSSRFAYLAFGPWNIMNLQVINYHLRTIEKYDSVPLVDYPEGYEK